MPKIILGDVDNVTHMRFTLAALYHHETLKDFAIRAVKQRIARSTDIPEGALEKVTSNSGPLNDWLYDGVESTMFTLPNGTVYTEAELITFARNALLGISKQPSEVSPDE